MMTINIKWNAIIAVLVFLAAAGIQAQNKKPIYYWGVHAGLNINSHVADFNKLPNYPCCSPRFEGDNGIGFAGGILAEYPLDEDFSLEGRLNISSLGVEMLSHELIGNALVRDQNGIIIPVDANVEHVIDNSIYNLALEPTVNYKAMESLKLSLGFHIGYLLSAKFDQQETLLKPDNVTFSDGTLVRNKFTDQEIPELNPLRFGLLLGAGFEVPLDNQWILQPEFRYVYSFTDITSVPWSINTFQIGIAIKIPVYEAEKVIEEKIPGPPIPTIEAVGIAQNGTRQVNPVIEIEEFEFEKGFPLLPHIFFPENSADLKETDLHLITAPQTSMFDEENMNWKTLDIYADLLNILGSRMKKYPDSKITVVGCNNNLGAEANNFELSQKRAEAVSDYLVSVWGIQKNRINISKRNLPSVPANNTHKDGQQENRRAEIISDDLHLFAPVVLTDVFKRSNPPMAEIIPLVRAPGGLKSWEINVVQDGEQIRRYSETELPAKLDWRIDEEPVPAVDNPVEIVFSVEDNYGQTASAATELEIKQKTVVKEGVVIKGHNKVEEYSLIVFEYDKSELSPQHHDILKNIKSRIKPDSRVTIEGYADRTGNKEYNKNLAERRIEEVYKLLGSNVKQVSLVPVGSDMLLFDNDLPQGRSYSRTVKVIIETPIED